MCDDLTITDGRYPNWRARIVLDEEAGQPWGDVLAPVLLIERHRASWATEVYQPKHAQRILTAWHHLNGDVFERYLPPGTRRQRHPARHRPGPDRDHLRYG